MTVWNVVEKLQRIEKAIEVVESNGVLHNTHFKEIVELLEDYRDSLYALEIKE